MPFHRGPASFVRSALFPGTRYVRYAVSAIVFVSSSYRYFVVVYRTDERLVNSLIVTLIVLFRFSSFGRVKVCVITSLVRVNVGFPSCVLIVTASVIVRSAFIDVS